MDHPEGNVYEEGDAETTRKNNPMTVGEVKQVTGYVLGKGKNAKTYQSGDVESLKLDLDNAESRVRWIKADLTDDDKAEIKRIKKGQAFTMICRKAKALKKALINASVGNKAIIKANPAFEGKVAIMLDYIQKQFDEGVDVMLNKTKKDADVPTF
jgi:hypothetical protein